MQRDFSKVTRLLKVVVIGWFTYKILFRIAFGWSLNETARFGALVFRPEYAVDAGWVISLAPIVLLAVRGLTDNKTLRWICAIFAVILNGIDFITNVAAFQLWWAQLMADRELLLETTGGLPMPMWIINAAHGLGFVFCFVVTWVEEISVFAIGTMLHMLAEVFPRFRGWFAVDNMDFFKTASGADLLQGAGQALAGKQQKRKKRKKKRRSRPQGAQPAAGGASQQAGPVRSTSAGGRGRQRPPRPRTRLRRQ